MLSGKTDKQKRFVSPVLMVCPDCSNETYTRNPNGYCPRCEPRDPAVKTREGLPVGYGVHPKEEYSPLDSSTEVSKEVTR